MNPAEQRQRFTAVSRVEQRLENVETTVLGLAQQLVDDRAERDRQIREVVDNTNAILAAGHEAQRAYIDMRDELLDLRIRALRDRTFWHRLRWLVRGV